MGADWYTCLTYYGYSIKVPDGINYRKFVNDLMKINEFLQEPYKITGILQSFHSRMEYASDSELADMDDYATIIIGFKPPSDLEYLTHSINELKEYVTDNHYFMGLEIAETAAFYSGIEWFDKYYEYVSSDDESEEDEEEDEEDEEDDEEEGEDEASSDEDEHKIVPESPISKTE
jgi:hypothetical protein